MVKLKKSPFGILEEKRALGRDLPDKPDSPEIDV